MNHLGNYFNLRKIPPSMCKDLRNKYLENWPLNMVGYYTLNNFIRWNRIKPNIENVCIYILEPIGENFEGYSFNGTFLIVDHDQLFFNTLYGAFSESLKFALSLFDWSAGYEVSACLDRHKDILLHIIKVKGLTLEWGNISTQMGYFKKEKATDLELNCPNDIDLRPLSEEDIMIADTIWPNRKFGSISLLKRLAKLNPSIGAFKKDTGEVVAWCFQLQAGSIKTLEVNDKNMGKGYGSLVVRAMAKVLGANNCDTFVCVRNGNDASLNTLKKYGFEFTSTCNWLRTKPTKPGRVVIQENNFLPNWFV